MKKNIKIFVFLLAIIATVSIQGQNNDDEFVKFLENKEIENYSNAGKSLTDYYEEIGLMEAIEGKEAGGFECDKVAIYQKEIKKLKSKIKEEKVVADGFVAEIKEAGDEKKKEYFERLNKSFDVIINQYDLGMAGYVHDNCN